MNRYGAADKLPDPDELWASIQDHGLDEPTSAVIENAVNGFVVQQSGLFGPGGRLQDLRSRFLVEADTVSRVLRDRVCRVRWEPWTGRYEGKYIGGSDEKDDGQTWFPAVRVGPSWLVQPVTFENGCLGYNVTYTGPSAARGRVAGYVHKSDDNPGINLHVGFGDRIGDHDLIVWLLPDEKFLEVVGPVDEPRRRRTAINAAGPWGRWTIEPMPPAAELG
ncbi:MAG: hypothetical protein AAFX76_04545 [Planctomycetota bacterium]